MLDINVTEAVMVGDQLFTDIYGANSCRMPNILVNYMRYDDEEKIGIKRHVEKSLLSLYKKIRVIKID